MGRNILLEIKVYYRSEIIKKASSGIGRVINPYIGWTETLWGNHVKLGMWSQSGNTQCNILEILNIRNIDCSLRKVAGVKWLGAREMTWISYFSCSYDEILEKGNLEERI